MRNSLLKQVAAEGVDAKEYTSINCDKDTVITTKNNVLEEINNLRMLLKRYRRIKIMKS